MSSAGCYFVFHFAFIGFNDYSEKCRFFYRYDTTQPFFICSIIDSNYFFFFLYMPSLRLNISSVLCRLFVRQIDRLSDLVTL